MSLTVEAGVRLIDIMTWAIPRHMHLPVLPGYPLVTVGGCVAADVHGKNPFKDGTFRRLGQGTYALSSAEGLSGLFRGAAT